MSTILEVRSMIQRNTVLPVRTIQRKEEVNVPLDKRWVLQPRICLHLRLSVRDHYQRDPRKAKSTDWLLKLLSKKFIAVEQKAFTSVAVNPLNFTSVSRI